MLLYVYIDIYFVYWGVINLPEDLFSHQTDFYKAMAHPTRLQILEILKPGERCVCEIFPALDLEQSNISRHLSIMKKAGLLQSRKVGLNVHYRVSDPRIFELLDLSKDIIRKLWLEKAEMVR